MTLQDKFETVRSILEEHNSVVQPPGTGQNPPPAGWVDTEKFFASLQAMGATTEDRVRGLSYEDIEALGVPKLIAKDIAKIFRGDSATSETQDKRPVSAKKADRMSVRELIECFDPENADDSVGKRLLSISKGEPFIVFSTARIVDVESTLKLLNEIKLGHKGRTSLDVNGEIKPVYEIGELPDNFADENPLYPNRPLRPDGTCDQTNRSWEGVPLEVRQLIRIVTQGKVTHDQAHDWLDKALEDDAFKKIRQRHHSAALEFDELKATGKLPTLKIVLGVEGGGANSPRPFPKAGR